MKIITFVLSILFACSALSYASEIILPRTGQTSSYAAGDDGAIKAGQPMPSPRFTDNNGNGSVTDNLTGLIWLKNANCTETVGGVGKSSGALAWANALVWSNSLASGKCGLTDGSTSGQWRLPTRKELRSLIDASKYGPALPTGHPFSAVLGAYWTSTTNPGDTASAGLVDVSGDGDILSMGKTSTYYVLPVRGGQ